MVLDAEAPLAHHLEPLADAVVEVDVGHLHLAPEAGERVGVDGEVVVLAGDLDLPGADVPDRVIATVVAERELHGARPERPAQQLVAEADPEDGDIADQSGDLVGGVLDDRRVTGPVRQEHPVGPRANTSAAGVEAGTTSTLPSRASWRTIVLLIP